MEVYIISNAQVVQQTRFTIFVESKLIKTRFLLHSGASLGVKFTVTEPNMELNWKIKPKTGPVKLSIYRRSIHEADNLANGSEATLPNRDLLQGKLFY